MTQTTAFFTSLTLLFSILQASPTLGETPSEEAQTEMQEPAEQISYSTTRTRAFSTRSRVQTVNREIAYERRSSTAGEGRANVALQAKARPCTITLSKPVLTNVGLSATVTTTDATGTPRAGAAVRFFVYGGAQLRLLSSQGKNTNGAGQATFLIPGGAGQQRMKLVALVAPDAKCPLLRAMR